MVCYYSTIACILGALAIIPFIYFEREALATVWLIFGCGMILVQVISGYTFHGYGRSISRAEEPLTFWASVIITAVIFLVFYLKIISAS